MIVRRHVGFSQRYSIKERKKLKFIANNQMDTSLHEQKPSSKSIQPGILKERKINDLNRFVAEEKLQLLRYYLRGNTMS